MIDRRSLSFLGYYARPRLIPVDSELLDIFCRGISPGLVYLLSRHYDVLFLLNVDLGSIS
jgi:hypothetical protein